MGKWIPHLGRRKCKNCGQWCELSKKDDFSGHKTWRDMCHTCHDVRTDPIALAKLAVGNKLQFLNNDNTMKKKVTAAFNVGEETAKLLETLKKDYGITRIGTAFNNDLKNYGGTGMRLMFLNLKKQRDKDKESARIKRNIKQNKKRAALKEATQVQKAFEIPIQMDSTTISDMIAQQKIQLKQLKILEKAQKMREEKEIIKKNTGATLSTFAEM
jgi:hypothetical protein